jgi:hypothetical protein
MVLIAAGSSASQRAVVHSHINALKPGGWIQIGDCDRVCPRPVAENPQYHEMWACVRAVCRASGVDPDEPPKFKGWLEDAGLEEVQERMSMRAVGARNGDGDLGAAGVQADLMIARAFAEGAKGESRVPFEIGVWGRMLMRTALDPSVKPLPDEKLDSLVRDLEVELTETGAYFPMRYVWGRKPL